MASSKDSLSQALSALVARKDAKIFQNLDAFEKAICEIGNCETTSEVLALKAGLQHRTPWELQKAAAGMVPARTILNLAENLNRQNSIPADLSLWAIETWAGALNVKFEQQPARPAGTTSSAPPPPPGAVTQTGTKTGYTAGTTRIGIIYGVTESGLIKVFKSWWKPAPASESSGLVCAALKPEPRKIVPLFSSASRPVKREKSQKKGPSTSFNISGKPPEPQPKPAPLPRPVPNAVQSAKPVLNRPAAAAPAVPQTAKVYTGSAEDLFAQARSLMPGHGTRVDMPEAIAMFKQAAKMGYVPAKSKIGEIYLKGLGVKTDVAEAAVWFRQAAEAGDPQGQFHLGTLYQCGMGVEFNLVTAQEWLSKAANNGHAEAREILNQLLQP